GTLKFVRSASVVSTKSSAPIHLRSPIPYDSQLPALHGHVKYSEFDKLLGFSSTHQLA
ncbi:hypothetical protein A2U01_0068711, partial [Trifolium medium]|nr:hypothetical protein [Trifolium medium]